MCIHKEWGSIYVYMMSVYVCIMSVGVMQGHICIYNECGGVYV